MGQVEGCLSRLSSADAEREKKHFIIRSVCLLENLVENSFAPVLFPSPPFSFLHPLPPTSTHYIVLHTTPPFCSHPFQLRRLVPSSSLSSPSALNAFSFSLQLQKHQKPFFRSCLAPVLQAKNRVEEGWRYHPQRNGTFLTSTSFSHSLLTLSLLSLFQLSLTLLFCCHSSFESPSGIR